MITKTKPIHLKPSAKRKPDVVPRPSLAAAAARTRTVPVEALNLAVDQIAASPYQPRADFPEAEIEELAATIAAHGQLQAILVRRLLGGQYELIDGERRLRAVRALGWPTIRAEVIECTDVEAAEAVYVATMAHKDFGAIEEARFFRRQIDAHLAPGPTELARRLRLSQGHVSNRLRLLELPADWQQRVISGEITPTQARDLVPYAAHPQILAEVATEIKRNKGVLDGPVFAEALYDVVHGLTEPLAKYEWNAAAGRRFPDLKLSEEQRAELGVIEVATPYSGEKEERATNVELLRRLRSEHIAACKARAEKRAGGKAAGNGQAAKPPSAAETKRAEEQEAARAGEQERLFRRRLWGWYVDWLRYLIARTIKGGHPDTIDASRAEIELLLLYLAADWPATTDYHRRGERVDLLAAGFRRRDWKQPSAVKPLAAILAVGSDTGDDENTIAAMADFVAGCFFDLEEGGATIRIPDDSVQAIADHLVSSPQRAWEREQAGEHLSRQFWELHTKDQLVALAKEQGVQIAGEKKSDLVDALAKPGVVKKWPKELAKIKPPK